MPFNNSASVSNIQRVIITGASKGLGKAIAEKFAAAGHRLFLCSRNEKELQATQQELQAKYLNDNIEIMAVDISHKENAIAFGNYCLQYGTPGIVVNNAGSFLPGSIHTEKDNVFETMLAVNLHSAYHLTRTVLPAMMEAKNGHI